MAKAKKQAKVKESASQPLLGAISNLFRGDPPEVAEVLRGYGLDAVQILPNFPSLKFSAPEEVTAKRCREVGEPFQAAGLMVAAVSAHTNFVDPDRARRRRSIKRFDALIEHCQEFGTKYLVTDSGTLTPAHPWEDCAENHSPAAMEALLANLRPSVKLAEEAGVVILLEGYLYHVFSKVSQAAQIREQLGEHVGFVMDPANFFSRGMVSSSQKQLQEIFKAIGLMAPVAHAKDVRYVGGELNTPRAGTGNLDYKAFLELLDAYQPGCPLIFEQIRMEELQESIDFIDRFYE